MSGIPSDYTVSIHYDKRLYRHDIAGSIAHARMLAKQKIISHDEAQTIVSGLEAIRDAPRAYNYLNPYGAQTKGLYDIDVEDELLRGVTMADCGNITVVPSEVVENFGKLTTVVEKSWSGVPSRWW